ncbi:DUF4340 domain-containing protein [Candidatus Poribacteria bacterium]|nr:DUF4340 domain-containing protein [Candidatus Poribacteria bacterium]
MRRNLYVLLIILAFLVIIALVMERPFGKGEKKKEEALFPRFDRAQVEKVEITENGETVELKREGDEWIVPTAKGYPADETAVDKMFDEMDEMTTKELISENPDKHPKFKVNEDGIEVKMLGKNDKTLAHFFVGKMGPDFISTYVRRADSKKVYLIPRTLRPVFGKGKTGWCDKEVLSFNVDDVSEVEIEDSGSSISLKKTDKGWEMTKPEKAEADKDAVEGILRTLSNFKADDVEIKKSESECGLDVPSSKVMIKLKDGTEKILRFGKEQNSRRYLKVDGKDQIFVVYKYRVSKIFKKPEDLKAKKEGEENEKTGGKKGK